MLVCPLHLGVDFSTMATDQPGDPDIFALMSGGTGLKLESAVVQEGGPFLLGDDWSVPALSCRVAWRR